ncbi:uncharacterized protein LOC106152800 isoform X2 [Lingula anatina]|uniref:Uncharacterized protein LOC106152800 isoform X2 n=1 Tax=Lingula anatina TaxID=7574 RepID=A0A1S3H795_LINAN|nr:uncharacterized protein LOC106152800 isoform X2 [Lingula anatina]|eukprot:XP_013381995.1 uncharacterized protein LOC106152800 isoform X2 [Lingula anatina]
MFSFLIQVMYGRVLVHCFSASSHGQNHTPVSLQWKDGKEDRYNSTWLRYNCHCDQCKQPHSGQITINPLSMPALVTIKSVSREGADLCLVWNEDPDHTGRIPLKMLRENSYSKEAIEQRAQSVKTSRKWDKIPEVTYDEVNANDRGLLRWLSALVDEGICLVKEVPTQLGTVKQVAEKIFPLQQTIYEEVFDVISNPEPINVAYSSSFLDFHMDLMYYESPPGLQFLHCVRFDPEVTGGESIFLDCFVVAEEFREQYPEDFETLARVPATFQKIHFEREYPVYMTYQRPHIALNHRREIVAVNWSPNFEGPLFVPEEDVEPYYKAYHRFMSMLCNSPHIIERHLNPGDLIVFNNRRVLHGRKAFELNGGMRHLQGCYVNIDEFKKKFQVLSCTVGDGRPAKRVGNHDFF